MDNFIAFHTVFFDRVLNCEKLEEESIDPFEFILR